MARIPGRFLAIAALALAAALAGCSVSSVAPAGRPRNVILLIGDGMGPEQLKAASRFAYGEDGRLFLQTLGRHAVVSTHSVVVVTDSAAASTAMATGRKVKNGVLSTATPGDGGPLKTALEYAQDEGRLTGLVTTTAITHATPAGFASHVAARSEAADIARQILLVRPNVLLSGGGSGMTAAGAEQAGYRVVTDRDSLKAAVAAKETRVCGLFGAGDMPNEYEYQQGTHRAYDKLPHLSEMAAAAVGLLEKGSKGKGFFLMIEGGHIDYAGHANDLPNNVAETLEFDNAVKAVMNWARGRSDTLVVVTADHETGGLAVQDNPGRGTLPTATWSTKNHTAADVHAFAWGAGSRAVTGELDNTDIFVIISGQPKPAPPVTTAPASAPSAALSGLVPVGAGQ